MSAPEILAPAGGQESLVAAVRAGADAVYLGAKGFNARRNAENFADLAEAVSYCHARGVKTHIALNTLVSDDELPALDAELTEICAAGADAVIVQDWAVARRARAKCPSLVLHASTQMAIHNAAGAKMAEDAGFARVVLARELSLREIEAIRRQTRLELEVFVHGALCMSASGMCYLSSALGERSGNRGLCAQPCRLNFRENGREYALSLKDLSNLRHLRALTEAGVDSFKIEGRMRRAEYVASAVDACRKALRGEPYDEEVLERMFSRAGFTDGYLTGKRTLAMFGHRREEDVAAEKEYAQMRALYRGECHRVGVDMRFSADAAGSRLAVSDGENAVEIADAAPEAARTAPTTASRVRESLGKTGDTPFFLRECTVELPEGVALPGAQINRMRREALAALLEKRAAPRPIPCQSAPLSIAPRRAAGQPKLRARFERFAQLEGFPLERVEYAILPAREIAAHPQALEIPNLVCELPALLYPGMEIDALPDGVSRALCENLGAVRLAREAGAQVFGGHGLNIFNSLALEAYAQMGVMSATLSCELTLRAATRMGGSLERGVVAYGRLPLMRLRACPVNRCRACPGQSELTDRKGVRFPLLCDARRYATLFNSVPLYIGDKRLDGLDFATLYFTIESPRECRAVLEAFERAAPPDFPRTTGQYFKGVL